MNLAERTRQARTYAKLTQVQLAEKACVTQQTISNIESGKQEKSADIVRIAIACGVRPEWLAEEQGEMVDGLYVQDERVKQLIKVCERLPDYAVDRLIQDGDALAELIDRATSRAASSGEKR